MKLDLRQWILGLGVIGAMTLCPTAARADLEVTASVNIRATTEFHAPLAPYGTWIEVGSYGRCWRPASVVVGWRPYCEGEWVWTDCGWYWQTDEPWGWACYHYGNWYEAPDYGWVWVPGIEWAPAWVSWRFGGGYCGWSPLPPHGVVVAPAAFVFVETRHFHEPIRRSRVIVNNTTIVNRTTVIGGPVRSERNISGQRAQSVFVNSGPDVAEVGRVTGKKPAPARIREVARRADPPEKVVNQIKQEQTQNARQAEPGARHDRAGERDDRNRRNVRDAAPDATANPTPRTETSPTPTPAPTPAPKPTPAPTPRKPETRSAPTPAPNPAPTPAPNRPQQQPSPPVRQQERPVTPAQPSQPVPPREADREPGRARGHEEVAPPPAPAPVPPTYRQPPGQERGNPPPQRPPQPPGKAKGQEKEKEKEKEH